MNAFIQTECVHVASEEGDYSYKKTLSSDKSAITTCGLYIVTDPNKVVEISIKYLDVNCESGALMAVRKYIAFVRPRMNVILPKTRTKAINYLPFHKFILWTWNSVCLCIHILHTTSCHKEICKHLIPLNKQLTVLRRLGVRWGVLSQWIRPCIAIE